jgi:hypothetical protein
LILTPSHLDEKYDPKYSYLSETKPYKSPPYEELIEKETKPHPPDKMYGREFKELI